MLTWTDILYNHWGLGLISKNTGGVFFFSNAPLPSRILYALPFFWFPSMHILHTRKERTWFERSHKITNSLTRWWLIFISKAYYCGFKTSVLLGSTCPKYGTEAPYVQHNNIVITCTDCRTPFVPTQFELIWISCSVIATAFSDTICTSIHFKIVNTSSMIIFI